MTPLIYFCNERRKRPMTAQHKRTGLATWIEANIELPQGLSAEPGPVRLLPSQREIADAITNSTIGCLTLGKPVWWFTCKPASELELLRQ